jgi:hypothetical protein
MAMMAGIAQIDIWYRTRLIDPFILLLLLSLASASQRPGLQILLPLYQIAGKSIALF